MFDPQKRHFFCCSCRDTEFMARPFLHGRGPIMLNGTGCIETEKKEVDSRIVGTDNSSPLTAVEFVG